MGRGNGSRTIVAEIGHSWQLAFHTSRTIPSRIRRWCPQSVATGRKQNRSRFVHIAKGVIEAPDMA